MRTLVFFLFAFVTPSLAFSQGDFKPAFIVKNNGDTVKGFIQEGNEAKLAETITFKKDVTETRPQYFGTAEVIAFGFDGGNVFKKISFKDPEDNTPRLKFAKYLLRGYNSLYTFLKDDREYFYVTNQLDSSYLLYDDIYTVSGTSLLQGNYKNVLLFIAGSCDNLKTRIGSMTFSDNEIMDYLTKVNNCVAPSTASEVMYKKPKMEMHIYAHAGGIYLGDKHELTGRVVTKFTLPSVDRKTSLNIGINYMQHYATKYVNILYMNSTLGYRTKENVTTNIVSIPFTMQYYFTNGKLRPYADAGFCYVFRSESGELDMFRKPTSSSDNGPSYVAAVGVDYNVTNNLFIKAEWRQELFLHYPTIGISYFFK